MEECNGHRREVPIMWQLDASIDNQERKALPLLWSLPIWVYDLGKARYRGSQQGCPANQRVRPVSRDSQMVSEEKVWRGN